MDCVLTRREDPFAFNPLEDLDDDELAPPIWSGPHVGKRMAEAMQTLRMLPMAGMAGCRSSWPSYAYSFADLIGQQEQGELEKTQRMQNRVRVLPSLSAISRMEIAI